MLKKVLVGLVVGVVTGLFGVAAHAGFVDTPAMGLFFALLLVAVGGWFMIEWFESAGWFVYLIAVFAVAVFVLAVPHSSDILTTPDEWVSYAYIILAPIVAIIPAFLVARADRRHGEDATPFSSFS